MSKWEEKRLGELIEINPETLSASKYTGEIKYIDIASVNTGSLERYTTYEISDAPSRARRMIKDKDIIFSTVRPNLRAYYFVKNAPPNAICSTGFAVLRARKGVNSRFVYSLVTENSFVDYLTLVAKGSAYPAVDTNDFKKAKVTVPDLPTQERIADILSVYDDLIEANNRRIELLEQTAQELYKEWFVRFRFPGYENAKFENGLPKGWELKKIGDIARVKSGYAFKSEWWIDEGVPVIKIKDIQGNTVDFSDLSQVSADHAEIAKQFYVVEGDLLIAMTGATIGKMALVPYSEMQMVVNQRVGKFFLGKSPAEKVAFLYMTLQQNWVQELIVMIAGSNAAQPNISPFDIEKIKVVYNKEMVDEYNKRSAPFIKQILQLRKQNQNLSTQRDMLLPRLMNGKLEV